MVYHFELCSSDLLWFEANFLQWLNLFSKRIDFEKPRSRKELHSQRKPWRRSLAWKQWQSVGQIQTYPPTAQLFAGVIFQILCFKFCDRIRQIPCLLITNCSSTWELTFHFELFQCHFCFQFLLLALKILSKFDFARLLGQRLAQVWALIGFGHY